MYVWITRTVKRGNRVQCMHMLQGAMRIALLDHICHTTTVCTRQIPSRTYAGANRWLYPLEDAAIRSAVRAQRVLCGHQNIGQTRTFHTSRVLEYKRKHAGCVHWRMAGMTRLKQAQSESKPKSLPKRVQAQRNPARCKAWRMHIKPHQKRRWRLHESAPGRRQLRKGYCRES